MDKQSNIFFHIDVNSAYLSWEAVERLKEGEEVDLRHIPSAIGGDESTRHGVVLARSVPAKRYGVITGESLVFARKKCPNLRTVPARHHIYEQYSDAFVKLLGDYSPCTEKFSIDECFLDYTNMEMHFGPPVKAAHNIKERIKQELGFTVNIGISTNKLLAKMAGELKKPDLVHTLYPEELQTKLWHLPIREMYMVGKVTAEILEGEGITTIGQLACTNPVTIKRLLGKRGDLVWNYANGIEKYPIQQSAGTRAKGISNATTLAVDITDRQAAYKVLLSLGENVSTRLRESGFRAQVISVSFRSSDFRDYSRQRKLDGSTNVTSQIYKLACELFDEAWKGEPLRLLGVSATELCLEDQIQLSICDAKTQKQERLDKVIDDIRHKYGESAVLRSTLLPKP